MFRIRIESRGRIVLDTDVPERVDEEKSPEGYGAVDWQRAQAVETLVIGAFRDAVTHVGPRNEERLTVYINRYDATR